MSMTPTKGMVSNKGKNTQDDASARGKASAADQVSGPAAGSRLGGTLKSGFVVGKR